MPKGIDALDAAIDAANGWPWWMADDDEIPAFRQELLSQFTVTRVERWTGVCGACGAACFKERWSDGSYRVDTHSSGLYGSDVPCDGSGW